MTSTHTFKNTHLCIQRTVELQDVEERHCGVEELRSRLVGGAGAVDLVRLVKHRRDVVAHDLHAVRLVHIVRLLRSLEGVQLGHDEGRLLLGVRRELGRLAHRAEATRVREQRRVAVGAAVGLLCAADRRGDGLERRRDLDHGVTIAKSERDFSSCKIRVQRESRPFCV